MQKSFHELLLDWHDKNGRKDLPWQKNKTAYRVWISEIMLQQTQVKTVIPYFLKFLKKFPTLKSLALAEQDDVLALWTGLGYYSRARNLHKTAIIIYTTLKNRFPNDAEGLIALPGIGRSTAHAILSIVHGQKKAILDGNVKRVLCRFKAFYGSPYDKTLEKKLWLLAESLMPETRTEIYTQAIMDLGATICTRTKPSCQICPLSKSCLALEKNIQHLLPEKKKSKKLPIREATFIIVQNKQNEVLLEKRPDKGLWGGLWVLPQFEDKKALPFKAFRHTFTHFHLDMTIQISKQQDSVATVGSQANWYNLNGLSTIGLPKPIADTLKAYFNQQKA
jgi:A/G-specific adenine glycosylase